MKLVIKSLLASAILATTAVATTAKADVSANVGFASEYFYRGILQSPTSGSAGIDWEANGFNAGAWAADVGDGVEVDLYGAYTYSVNDDLSFSVGFTDYEYTGEFDTVYREINLGAAYGPVSIGYSEGVHEAIGGGDDEDYGFLEVKLEHKGFYGKVATYSKDFEGEYLELGYGKTVSDIDLGVVFILNSKELSNQTNSSGAATTGEALVFTIGKTFDL